MKRERFCWTKRSELKVESSSLGMLIMTWIPVPIRARSASGFESKSFTLVILFALRRSTTVEGLSLWNDSVPQFTPIAEWAWWAARRKERVKRATPLPIFLSFFSLWALLLSVPTEKHFNILYNFQQLFFLFLLKWLRAVIYSRNCTQCNHKTPKRQKVANELRYIVILGKLTQLNFVKSFNTQTRFWSALKNRGFEVFNL